MNTVNHFHIKITVDLDRTEVFPVTGPAVQAVQDPPRRKIQADTLVYEHLAGSQPTLVAHGKLYTLRKIAVQDPETGITIREQATMERRAWVSVKPSDLPREVWAEIRNQSASTILAAGRARNTLE